MQRNFMLPALLISLTLWGLVELGFWQLDRAEQKRTIENAIIAAQSSPPQPLSAAELLGKEYYQVLLKGHYDSAKQFIYDNQIVNSNAGYYVLTPFVLDAGSAILVNRGFIPWNGKRSKLANIQVSQQPISIQARLIKPSQRIKLKQSQPSKIFPLLIQSLDIDQLSQLSGYQIVPMLAQLDASATNGFYRKWQPFYGSINKHLGYAVQWFLMALALSIIAAYLLIKNWKK
ncbi:MAG: SURF1 family protein [Candidatus Thioglobus sp.]|nr:MAG: SURF1 family protein [Candidatus Thioglobus sp.]KAA0454661.1 MAG: SURF1 family protein [Candidatus Thioglobus sp.]